MPLYPAIKLMDTVITQDAFDFTAEPTAPAMGDFDNNGDVDGRDFLVWQRGNATPDSVPVGEDGGLSGDQLAVLLLPAVHDDGLLLPAVQTDTDGGVRPGELDRPAQFIARATGVTGNDIIPPTDDAFDFRATEAGEVGGQIHELNDISQNINQSGTQYQNDVDDTETPTTLTTGDQSVEVLGQPTETIVIVYEDIKW